MYRDRPEGIFSLFFRPDSRPPRYICFYSEKRRINLYRPFFSPLHGLLEKRGGLVPVYVFLFPAKHRKRKNYETPASSYFFVVWFREGFGVPTGSKDRVTTHGKFCKPPQTPTAPQRPLRILGETLAENPLRVSNQGSTPTLGRGVCETKSKNGLQIQKTLYFYFFCAQRGLETMFSIPLQTMG